MLGSEPFEVVSGSVTKGESDLEQFVPGGLEVKEVRC